MVKYILQLLHSTICNYLISSAVTLTDTIFSSLCFSLKEKNISQRQIFTVLCLRGSYIQYLLTVVKILCRISWLPHLDPSINSLLAVFRQCDVFIFFLKYFTCKVLWVFATHNSQSALQTGSKACTLQSTAEQAVRTVLSPQTSPVQTLLMTVLYVISLLDSCVVVTLVEWAVSLQNCGVAILYCWSYFFSHR